MTSINKWALALYIASALTVTGAQAQPGPIRIGLPVPLTGPYGADAKDQVKSAEIAIKEFNDAGGLNGRKAELLVRDDKLDPTEAALRALELIEKDKVNFIVGGLSAATQLATNSVTKQHKVLYISISQSDTINEVSDHSRYTFHEALNPYMTTRAVGQHVFKKGMRIAFITADYAYGHEMARGFTRVAEEIGAQIVGEVKHPLGTSDYSSFLPLLQALKPDVLVFNNLGRDNHISIKQAADVGMKKSMVFATPVLMYTARLAGGPKVYDGVIGGTSYYWSIQDKSPSAKKLNNRYQAINSGAYPSDYGAMAYSAVKSLLTAVKDAGTVDTEEVIDALIALKYDTHKGEQYYRLCDHQSVQSIFIIQSKEAENGNPDDVFNVLETIPASESMLRTCAELGHT